MFTIGFTRKSVETFFTRLKDAGIRRLVDVRLNNVSQLAGFAPKDDLRYFTKTICQIDYIHLPELAAKKSRTIAIAGWWRNTSSSIGTMSKLNTFLKQTLT